MRVHMHWALLLACGGSGLTAGGCNPPGRQPVTRLATELLYTRTGGFVGTDDRIVVRPDGALTSSGRLVGEHTRTLSAAQLGELLEVLQSWSQLEVRGPEPSDVADVFEHEVSYAGRTLRWTDATHNVPDELSRLVRMLVNLAQ